MNSTAPPLDGFLAQDQSNRLIIVVIIFAILEALFIGLFFAARVRMGTARAVDTYLMIPAFIMAYSHLLVSLLWIKYAGLGRHWAWVSQSPLLVTRYLKMKLVMLMINGPGITLPKLAILCLYLRIFQVKPYRFATFVIGGILIATWIASWSVAFAMCTPYSFQWNKSIEGGTCLNEFSFYIWMGIPSIATDLAMIILPMPIIWRLQTSIGQRIGLTITFVAGGLGIVTAVIRFVVFLQLQDPSFDLSWTGTEVVMWTTIEPGVYLIAACLPSLRPVLLPFFNGLDFHGVRSLLGIESRNCNTPPSGLALSGVRRPRRVWRRQRSREKDLPFKHSDEQVWRGTFGDAGNANCYRESLSEDTQRGNSRAQAAAQFENKDFSQAIIVETAFTVSTQPRFA